MKSLSRTAIQRMVGVTANSVGGVGAGGGGGGADLTGMATQAWVNENYLSIEFFSSLFKAYDSAATPNEIQPNDGDTSAITNIKAMFGFWTEQYLSALGMSAGGGGSTGTLSSIGLVMPTGFSVSPGTLTSDGSFTVSFATGYSLPLTADVTKGVTAYGWGDHANAGYLTSVAFSDLTTHPTTLAGYGITDAKFGTAGSDYVPITLGNTTKNVLTSHQSLSAYATKTWVESNAVYDDGGNFQSTDKIYDIVCKRVFSGYNMPDAPDTGWVSGLVLGSNWNNNHYQHYLVESGRRWYTTRTYENGAMKDWETFAYLTDNVASATKLATARSLWGNDFDGSDDVSGLITATNGVSVPSGKYVKIGSLYLTYDSENNALRVSANADGSGAGHFYATGAVSALGYSANGGGGTGTLSSIGLVMPEGFSVSPATLTSDGSFTVSFATGYSLPTTEKQSNWDAAYTNRHTHSNKSILDGITSTKVSNWDSALGNSTTFWGRSVSNGAVKGGLNNALFVVFEGMSSSEGNGGYIQFCYNNSSAYTSRIIEDRSGRLNANDKLFVYKSGIAGNSSDLVGGATSWTSTMHAVVNGNTLIAGDLFVKNNLNLANNQAVKFLTSDGQKNINALFLNSGSPNALSLGYGARINGLNTEIQGNNITFAVNQSGGTTRKNIATFNSYGLFFNNNLSLMWAPTSGPSESVLTMNSSNNIICGNYSRTLSLRGTGIDFYLNSTNIAGVCDITTGNVNVKGLRVGDGVLMWDSTNNALKVIKSDGSAANLYATGGVSALGFTPTIDSINSFTITNLSTDTVTATNWSIDTNGYVKVKRLYLDSTRYLFMNGTTLKFHNGSTDKTVQLV